MIKTQTYPETRARQASLEVARLALVKCGSEFFPWENSPLALLFSLFEMLQKQTSKYFSPYDSLLINIQHKEIIICLYP